MLGPIWSEGVPGPATRPTIDQRRAEILFEALVCEIHTAALQTAIVTSAVNGTARSGKPLCLSTLDPFMPRDTTILQILKVGLIESDFSLDELMFVDEFLAGLAAGHEAIGDYAREVSSLGPERAGVLCRQSLTDTWRVIAHLARNAISEISLPLHRRLPEPYGANSLALVRLLTKVERGATPCLGADGAPFTPAMPQQRRSLRRMLCQECVLKVRGLNISAFAKDVSPGGFGLERVPELTPGEVASVELASGRTFAGTIAWSGGSKAGLRLAAPLGALDPLLTG
jgi:hypothetical protein